MRSDLLEYYHNTVTPVGSDDGGRYELAKCRCRCWFCPDCCSVMGYNLRAKLVPILETFHGMLMITLTIDPELFPNPQTAYLYVMDRRCISVTTQDLSRWNYLNTHRYFYVVEWQENTEQAHFHVLYDSRFILWDDLNASWSKHRPGSAGPVKGNRPGFGTVHFRKDEFEGGPAHAARYATKYLIKIPKQGFPKWVMAMGEERRVRRYSTSRGFWGTVSERSEGKGIRKKVKKSYKEKIAECGESVTVFEVNQAVDRETGEITEVRRWVGELDVSESVIDKIADNGNPKRRRRKLKATSLGEVRRIVEAASGKGAKWKRRRVSKV